MGLGNYEACKYFRRFTRELTPEEHGNVFCVTHPDSEGQGSTDLTRSAYENRVSVPRIMKSPWNPA